MRQTLLSLCLLFGLLGAAVPARARAVQPITVSNDLTRVEFPSQITFSTDVASSANVTAVTLEYSVEQRTCGTVVAKAVPAFTPAPKVKAAWTWKMADSGSLPPGAKIHWQWQATDANGAQTLSDQHTILWLDSDHLWQRLSGRQVNVFWYQGGQDFGLRMQGAALAALDAISLKLGLQPDKPIDFYVYADAQDMQQAVLGRPDWVGGIAFPQNAIALAGVAPADEAWGRRVAAHELTHIVVGGYGFSCLGARPAWLDEGLATYIEGGPLAAEQAQFQSAVHDGSLLALSALDGGFSQDDFTVSLAYTESESLVSFLVTRYGAAKLLALIRQLSNGLGTEQALQAVYGFGESGLENAWRTEIGAAR